MKPLNFKCPLLALALLISSSASLAVAQNAPLESGEYQWTLEQSITMQDQEAAQISLLLVLGEGIPSPLLLPIPEDAQEIVLTTKGAPLDFTQAEDLQRHVLQIPSASMAPGDALELHYLAPTYGQEALKKGPHETLEHRFAFTNTTLPPLAKVDLNLALPKAHKVQRIIDTTPKINPKSPTIPYDLQRADERAQLWMSCSDIGPGESCAMRFAFKKEGRSWLPLIVGLLIAIGYLIFFRHVLRPPEEEKKQA